MKVKRIIFLSYHYFPDQSAGATRSKFLINELLKHAKSTQIWLFCGSPNRYEKKFFKRDLSEFKELSLNRLKIIRIWTPYLGQNKISIVIAYSFFFLKALILSLYIKPDIVFATSAKLFTGFLGALIARFNSSLFFLDLRDTFVANFYYFYRNKKRLMLHSIFSILEKFTFRSSFSINLISIGFKELFTDIDKLSDEYGIKITNFPNGIDKNLRKKIENIKSSMRKDNKTYRILYVGNLGEGQEIFQLILNISKDEKTIKNMKKNNIIFGIYGAGSEVNKIKKLLFSRRGKEFDINDVVQYYGFVKKENIHEIYKRASCLMLQLSKAKSIECVIPSKIFEYASTNLPILYGASGFASDFISKVNGSIPFDQLSAKSFYEAIIFSKIIKISRKQRSLFLDNYLIKDIYKNYAKYILSSY